MASTPEQALADARVVVNTADLRLVANQLAHALEGAFRAHGWALTVKPEPPMGGHPYVRFEPLRGDVVQLVIAGLERLRGAEQ